MTSLLIDDVTLAGNDFCAALSGRCGSGDDDRDDDDEEEEVEEEEATGGEATREEHEYDAGETLEDSWRTLPPGKESHGQCSAARF